MVLGLPTPEVRVEYGRNGSMFWCQKTIQQERLVSVNLENNIARQLTFAKDLSSKTVCV